MHAEGKTVIITGAAGGIGAALARHLDRCGPQAMMLLDLEPAALGEVRDTLECAEVITAPCDVSDPDALNHLVVDMENRYGGVDLFCANAGIFIPGDETLPLAEWQRAIDVNVMSHVYAARACLPGMLARGQGYFLHTVSAAGLLSQIGSAPYSVSKHGALSFAEWLSITYGDRGIGVTALCPQGVDTGMLDDIDNLDSVAGDGLISADLVAECAVRAIREEQFLALPHPAVIDYFQRKAGDYDRWISGMRRLQTRLYS